MEVTVSSLEEIEGWLALAREVEPLFGPMIESRGFLPILRLAVMAANAFCIRAPGPPEGRLAGGIVISREFNEISWMAVSLPYRGRGYGRALLSTAIRHLSASRAITVQTFDKSVPDGRPARRLYKAFGFFDHHPAGLNHAGFPTMIMRRAAAAS